MIDMVKLGQKKLSKLPLIFNKNINFPFCLGPMVGLSHFAMREVVRSYLPEGAVTLWPSEMLSSRRLPDEKLNQNLEVTVNKDESFWHPQVLGNEEKFLVPTISKLEDWGAQGIDINMGCPVKKVLRHNWGVALMGDPDYAARVVEIVKNNTNLPVSVKLRSGLKGADNQSLLSFLNHLKNAGVDWVTIHPRNAAQKRRGSADWTQFNFIKENVDIPLIGNGDVQTSEDALNMYTQFNVDMVMIGRALTARPWMLWQIGHSLGLKPPIGKQGEPPLSGEEEGAEFGKVLKQMINLMMERNIIEFIGVKKIQFYIRTSMPWLFYGHALFSHSSKAKSYIDLLDIVEAFFSRPQKMMKKTNLKI